MPNSIWTGSLSFGLVVVPVRLYPAIRKKQVRFHEVDRYGRRVRHVRVSEPDFEAEAERPFRFPSPPPAALESPPSSPPPAWTPAAETYVPAPTPEVPYEEIRKGFEIAPGQYVSLTREEVAALAPEKSRVIDVELFVKDDAIDPIHNESRYYVAPDRSSARSFNLLAAAMAEARKVAVGWITLRQRRYLSAIRPYHEVMLLTTMVHADEVLPAESLAPFASEDEPSERELKMARLLIDTLSGPFEPERFEDEHRKRVLKAIEEKTPLAIEPEVMPSPTRVMDLMAALEASVKAAKAAKAQREDSAGKPARRRRA